MQTKSLHYEVMGDDRVEAMDIGLASNKMPSDDQAGG